MSTVCVKIDLDASIDRVWETVMDPSRLKDWVTIHRAVRDVSDQPLHRGSTMDQVLHLRGVSFHVHWTLADVSAPNHAEWEGRGPAHSQARIRYDLTPKGDHATVFEYTNEFTPPGGSVGHGPARPPGSRTRATRARRSSSSSSNGRRTRRTRGRRGGNTRANQALKLVSERPGITIPEIAQAMRIEPNYLYRVLPKLAAEGQVRKDGQGCHPAK